MLDTSSRGWSIHVHGSWFPAAVVISCLSLETAETIAGEALAPSLSRLFQLMCYSFPLSRVLPLPVASIAAAAARGQACDSNRMKNRKARKQ